MSILLIIVEWCLAKSIFKRYKIMNKTRSIGGLTLISLAILASTNLQAKGLGQQSLEEVVVKGVKQKGSLTSLSSAQARDILENIPGGIGFVDVADYEDNFTQSLGDTLVFTPGVFADTSAQRENRISIRGSGLSATFERRGINVYRDGVPITRASGITEFQEVDPLSVKYIEVLKGGNGVRFGTNALGGAVNIVTPTGANTEAGSKIRIESGSFDSTRVNASTAGKSGNIDYYATVTKLDSDGFREQSDVDSIYGFANIGIQLTDNIETRFYVTSLNDKFELAGSVTEQEALDNPQTAVSSTADFPFSPFGPFDAIGDDNDRNLKVNRFSNRTVFDFSSWQLETGAWIAQRELDHAITRFAGIIVQDETEIGANFRASNERSVDNGLIWSVGATYSESQNDALVFNNDFGQRGELNDSDDQDAENFSVYGQLNIPLTERLQLITGLQYQYTERVNNNLFIGDNDDGQISYNEYSPTVGLLWKLNDAHQVYANVNQANEAPGITDITSSDSSIGFQELDVQESTTVEVGTRGQTEHWSWDLSLYRSIIKNELIDFQVNNQSVTDNSDSDTVHQGIEAGVDWSPSIAYLNNKGVTFTWRHVLTVNDFRFQGSETFGNNKLAGVPDFNYLTELNLLHEKWKLAFNVRYIDNGPYADFSNNLQTQGYTLLELNGSYNITDSLRLFFSVENLTDENYISNVATSSFADETSDDFTPGQGRAYFAGFNLSF